MIEQKVDKLRNANGKDKHKRSNILNILENIELSIFDGAYLHYFDKSKITKESIATRTKIKKAKVEYD